MQKYIVPYKLFILLFVAVSSTLVYSQNTVLSDSIDQSVTPFRKGRWLTSLSGNISTTTNEVKSINRRSISNDYGINLSTGKFFKERWLFGVAFQAERNESKGEFNVVGESFYIGPQFARYFSKTKDGSLFLNVSPGFVMYRSRATINEIPDFLVEADGNGFGTLVSLGYSYVIRDLISFNIGFNLGHYWIGVDSINSSGIIESDNIKISNFSFSFGFGVILDDFFF